MIHLRQKWRLIALAMASMLFIAACTSPPSQAPEAAVAEPVSETVEEAEPNEPEKIEAVEVSPVVETSSDSDSDSDIEEPATESEANNSSAATEKGEVDTSRYDDFEIITLLPPDAIPSIDNPTFHTADEADDFYDPDELVMGVVFNGDARAYSVPHLSSHEIVNDEVGGVKIAVTW